MAKLIIIAPYTKDPLLVTVIQMLKTDEVKVVVHTETDYEEDQVILVLGAEKTNELLGIDEKISKVRGTIHELYNEKGKLLKVIPSYSTNFASRSDDNLQTFVNDVELAYKLAVGIPDKETKDGTITILCDTLYKVQQAIDYIKQVGECAFDFESTGLNHFEEGFKATLLSLSFQHGSSYIIPLDHFESPFSDSEKSEIKKLIKELFNNENVAKIAHNAKFDLHICKLYDFWPVSGKLDDTMLMAHLLDEQRKVGLKGLVDDYFNNLSGYEDELKPYKNKWGEIPLQILSKYAGTDTDATLRLKTQFENELLKDLRVYTVYRNLQIPALRALQEMEFTGMLIDRDSLEKYIFETERAVVNHTAKMMDYPEVNRYEMSTIDELKQEAIFNCGAKLESAKEKYKESIEKGKTPKAVQTLKQKLQGLKTGQVSIKYKGLNFGSQKQLKKLLYTDKKGFKLPYVKDERTGQPIESTKVEILSQIKDKSGFIKDLLLLRSVSKILTTYLRGIYDRLDNSNRLHTSFLQHGTQSGRLSSKNPNIQNLPTMSKNSNELAQKVTSYVKKIFTVPEGHQLIQMDYSQAELRIVASFAKESEMLEAYANDRDLHAVTAANMIGVDIDDFYGLDKDTQKKWRTRAKAGNFGLLYGMSAHGFKEYARNNYGVTLTDKEAEETRKLFFKTYPNLLTYHAEYIKKAQTYGYVRTLFGRRRHTPDIHSKDQMRRSMDERVSINSPIQGSAGEFTIFAIALLHNRLDERVKIINTVHDSIIFYCPDELVESTITLIRKTCENLPTKQYFGKELNIGMKVDIELSATSWGDLH